MKQRVRRAATANPRRFAALVAAVCVMFGSLGLDAAAALPGAVRHLTDHVTNTIVHTFGVPQAPSPSGPVSTHGSRSVPAAAASGAGGGHLVALGSVSSNANAPAASTGNTTATTPAPAPSASGGSPAPTPPSHPAPSDPNPPAKRPKKTMQKDPGTPPGFPTEWRQLAIDAARAELQTCAQSLELAPVGCPQQPEGAGVLATPDSVQWSLLNQPLAGAAAVAQPKTEVAGTAVGTQVSVFGLFQMDGSYTLAGADAQPYRVYSGGVAFATLTWNGSAFTGAGFASGPYTGPLPTGVSLPPFARPTGPTDADVVSAVGAGFAACAAASTLPDASIPNCPQVAPAGTTGTGWQWTLTGDPSQKAVVTFDTAHGNFTVTGTYAMTLNAGGSAPVPVTGTYTATLAFDGAALQLIAIGGS